MAAGLRGVSQYSEAEAFALSQRTSGVIWDHLRSLLRRRAYTVFVCHSRPLRRRLEHLLAHSQFDLIHLDSMDLAGYLPLLPDVPVVCTHHNVESDLLRRRSKVEGGFLRRTYMALQADLMEAEERRICPTLALNVTVSPRDAERLRTIAPGAAVTVVPNGVDTKDFTPTSGPREGLVFVGGYHWYPNREGMAFFSEHILPLLKTEIPELPVTWVGRAPPGIRKEYADKFGIRMTGHVPDIRPAVRDAACYIVPLLTGGGSRLKIIDAWAMGKAVVSTAVGCEGLEARDGKNILVRDSPAAFADAVLAVLRYDELRDRLGKAGRETAERIYDWDSIGPPLAATYEELSGTG